MKNFRTTILKIPHSHCAPLICVLVVSQLLGGCVSVQLPNSAAVHAHHVELQEPASPFQSIKTENADRAWQSTKTGSTIFYISDCNPNSDPELTELVDEAVSAMSDVKVISNNNSEIYNERAALETLTQGKIDGVTLKLWVLVFKKNGCSFTLSLSGSEKTFDSERSVFEAFKKNFKVGAW